MPVFEHRSVLNRKRNRRILAWPRDVPLDPYYRTLNDGLEAAGWLVVDFRYWRPILYSYSIVHIHQGTIPFRNKRIWVALPRMILAMVALSAATARGARIVWSLHNLGSHEQFHPSLEAYYLNWLTRRLSLSIHMSDIGRSAALRRYPELANQPSTIIPLMHFGNVFPKLMPQAEARRHLAIDTELRMILMLGQIRRYKNVPELIRVFRTLPDDGARLFIVGNPHDASLISEIRNLAADPRIFLSLRAATAEEITLYMAAASLIIAPFQEILNSGTALLGLTHQRPVLLPQRGAMAELQAAVGPDWVRLYEPPLTSRELIEALAWATRPRHDRPNLQSFAPNRIIAEHARIFGRLLAPSGR